MRLDGKVSLITGGTKGIGAATAVELARLGSDIVINGRQIDEQANSVKEKVTSLQRRCLVAQADMSVPDQAARCVQEATTQLGGVDILVHAAGEGAPGSLLDIAPE